MRGKYQIYKLVNYDNGDELLKFYLPEKDIPLKEGLRRQISRLLDLDSLKSEGYQVYGILYVTKDVYLNARLDEVVKEYCYLDNSERETRVKYKKGLMSQEVAMQTLELIQDQKWSDLKRINHLIHRMVIEDIDVENEIALMLNDQYLKAIF